MNKKESLLCKTLLNPDNLPDFMEPWAYEKKCTGEEIKCQTSCKKLNKSIWKNKLAKAKEQGSLLNTIKQLVDIYLSPESFKKISKLYDSKNLEDVLGAIEDGEIEEAIDEIKKLINTYPDYANSILQTILDKTHKNLLEKYSKSDKKSQKKMESLKINFPEIERFFKQKERGVKVLNLLSDKKLLKPFLRFGIKLKNYNNAPLKKGFFGFIGKGFFSRKERRRAENVAYGVRSLDLKKIQPMLEEFINFYLEDDFNGEENTALDKTIATLNLSVSKSREVKDHILRLAPQLPSILASMERSGISYYYYLGKALFHGKRIKMLKKNGGVKLLDFQRLIRNIEKIHVCLDEGIKKSHFLFKNHGKFSYPKNSKCKKTKVYKSGRR